MKRCRECGLEYAGRTSCPECAADRYREQRDMILTAVKLLYRDEAQPLATRNWASGILGWPEFKKCAKCGDRLRGHEDESGTHCRFCVTAAAHNPRSRVDGTGCGKTTDAASITD